MSFYSIQDAFDLALLLQYHDANCRHDLSKGFITSERDYVSNLATHLRYPAGSLQNSHLSPSAGMPVPIFDGEVKSFTLPPSYEQLLGFDGIIILQLPNKNRSEVQYKVGLFEAKWPRMFGGHQHLYQTKTGNRDTWDTIPVKTAKKPHPESHFSSQLIRQHDLAGTGLVLWEQFFSEEGVGKSTLPEFKRTGSTCVFHDETYLHMTNVPKLDPQNKSKKNACWKRAHLTQLLKNNPTHTLASIIFGMAVCKYGKPIVGTPNKVTLPVSTAVAEKAFGQFGNGIPINLPTEDPSSNGEVLNTMRKYGFTNYTYITLSEAGIARAAEEERLELVRERKAKIDRLLESFELEETSQMPADTL